MYQNDTIIFFFFLKGLVHLTWSLGLNNLYNIVNYSSGNFKSCAFVKYRWINLFEYSGTYTNLTNGQVDALTKI